MVVHGSQSFLHPGPNGMKIADVGHKFIRQAQ